LEPFIDLASGAEGLELARDLALLVRENVERDASKRTHFNRLRGSVAIIADDVGTALTLRFDYGRLIIHEGLVGVPDVTLRGGTAVLQSLSDVPSPTLVGISLGALGDHGARDALSRLAKAMRNGDLKIYGLLLHPRLVTRLLHVLSRKT
jgi:hypothetical protein